MDINIPSQVKTYANLAAFPITGSVKTIYIAEDSKIAYYWNGSTYQPISIQDLSGLFPNPTGDTTQYIRGDGSLETFPTIPDVSGFQSKPVVVNSNITAQNDTVYHVIANSVFTDPTPVQGRGYVVFLRNGTATIGSVPFTNNSIYYRIFHSGSWLTYRFDNSNSISNNFTPQFRTINGKALTSNITLTPADIGAPSGSGTSTGTNTGDQDLSGLVPTSRTINGLDLTANRTLTTGNINDSANRRYVTDAQLTVIGNTSGTNTGDETQSSILSKLGWIRRLQKGGTITGTAAETVVHTFEFASNEYPSSSILHIEGQFIRNGSPTGNGTIRFRINTSNTIVGSTQIAQTTMGGNPNLFSQFRRKFDIESGLVKGINSASNTITDLITSTLVPLSASLDTTQSWWLFVTYQANNSADTAICNFSEIKNF